VGGPPPFRRGERGGGTFGRKILKRQYIKLKGASKRAIRLFLLLPLWGRTAPACRRGADADRK